MWKIFRFVANINSKRFLQINKTRLCTYAIGGTLITYYTVKGLLVQNVYAAAQNRTVRSEYFIKVIEC